MTDLITQPSDEFDLDPGTGGVGETSWATGAVCAQTDPELFFPMKGDHAREAKALCASCDVSTPCVEFAIANNMSGIWGGTTRRERAFIARKRELDRHRTTTLEDQALAAS